jgi:phosphoribosylpyrophosphate synthetase
MSSRDNAEGRCTPSYPTTYITAIVLYQWYARADKRHGMVATVLQVGIDHLLTVDLHAPQIEGFFQTPERYAVDDQRCRALGPRVLAFLRQEASV